MKIIITEEQNEKLNRKIKSVVEKLGLKQSRELFGKEIIKQAYSNNPSSFLNQFNNLRPVEKNRFIFYVDNDNLPFFYYDKKEQELKNGHYWIYYYGIWSFFSEVMGYDNAKIIKIMEEWLGSTYNLRELIPHKTSLLSILDWKRPII